MTRQEKEWVLNLPTEMKLSLMEDMLKEEKIKMAFDFMKMLLDAPITEGGVSTEEINAVWEKYYDN